MPEEDPRITDVKSYTEASHTAYADVTGAEPLTAGSRQFTPGRIVVKYDWRTQLGDKGWKVGNIEISGRWVDEAHAGSGLLILSYSMAPAWARLFAMFNLPISALVDAEGKV